MVVGSYNQTTLGNLRALKIVKLPLKFLNRYVKYLLDQSEELSELAFFLFDYTGGRLQNLACVTIRNRCRNGVNKADVGEHYSTSRQV